MRTREMSYSDYGITKEEKEYIKAFCRNAGEEEKQIIKEALAEIHPYIAPYIYKSLVENLSYDNICKKNYLYMCMVDFYAYRRQGMAAIKRWMILYGVWKM